MMYLAATILELISGLCLSVQVRAEDKKTDDFPKLIISKWEITKAGGNAPAGTVLEFTKDKSVIMILKMEGDALEVKGTYTLEKDKVTLKFDLKGMKSEEVLTIKKLTEDALELEDKDGGLDIFKKKK